MIKEDREGRVGSWHAAEGGRRWGVCCVHVKSTSVQAADDKDLL